MPVKKPDGSLRGVIGDDILLTTITDAMKTVNLHGQGYGFLIDQKGIFLAHPDEKLLSTNLSEIADLKPFAQEIITGAQGMKSYLFNGEKKIMLYQKIPTTGWTLAITVPEDVVYAQLSNIRLKYIAVDLLALLLGRRILALLLQEADRPHQGIAATDGPGRCQRFDRSGPDPVPG